MEEKDKLGTSMRVLIFFPYCYGNHYSILGEEKGRVGLKTKL